MAGRVRLAVHSHMPATRTTGNRSSAFGLRPKPQLREENNRRSENEGEDGNADEDDSTLRAMSTLVQQERAHPTLRPVDYSKAPGSTPKPKSAVTDSSLPLQAVRLLLLDLEREVRGCDRVGDDSRLIVALESAKYELAEHETRRRAAWTRVLALATQLKLGSVSARDGAAELAALAHSRLDMETADLPLHGGVQDFERGDRKVDSDADAVKQVVDTTDSNQNEDDGAEPVDDAEEPSGVWMENRPSECRCPVEIEFTALRAAKLPLSLTVAEPIKKSVQEPKPPKPITGMSTASGASTAGCMPGTNTAARSTRLKFQFPDAEVTQWQDEEEDASKADGDGLAPSSRSTLAALPLLRRRVSSATTAAAASPNTLAGSVITGSVPLRRKSFTMKRSPRKNLLQALASDATFGSSHRVAFSPSASAVSPSSASPPLRSSLSMRRKSTGVVDAKHLALAPSSPGCRSTSRRSSILLATTSPSKSAASLAAAASSSSSPSSSAGSQLVLRVRERKGDGVRELVLRKKTRMLPVVWHWHDRHRGAQSLLDECERVVRLGPHQHGVMLRQLRFVKAAMHDFPWAKTHLHHLLARYTSQQVTKEALYPQLALLSTQVHAETASKAARAKEVAARKQRLTVQLTLATGVVNDIRATKFGRRGRPHATRLCFDPSDPLRLRWVRKSGELSDECLAVDALEVLEAERALLRDGGRFDLKRVPKASAAASGGSSSSGDAEGDCACLLSLVTGSGGRALDLCVKSPLHREWLAMALREVAAFARQYRASGADVKPRRCIANCV